MRYSFKRSGSCRDGSLRTLRGMNTMNL
jgi:hypothetical protein